MVFTEVIKTSWLLLCQYIFLFLILLETLMAEIALICGLNIVTAMRKYFLLIACCPKAIKDHFPLKGSSVFMHVHYD